MFHRACSVSALAVTGILCSPAGVATAGDGKPDASAGCFSVGGGYLRARMRGALDLDLNWSNADMQCEGGPRPSGNGLRVSIGGPARGDEHRLRLVFGIAGVRALRAAGIAPSVWHINEGHPAFMVIERARDLVAQGVPFEAAIQAVEKEGRYSAPVVTAVEQAKPFYRAEESHQDYYRNNPDEAYCRAVIRPKLKKLGLDY